MTEEELERQTRLWHTEDTLADEKAQAVRTQLKAALPAARTRRRWQTGGIIALALTSVPLGGALVVALSVDPLAAQTRIEPLHFPVGLQGGDVLVLATDGTVAGTAGIFDSSGMSAGFRKQQYLMWHPGSSVAETLRVPGATWSGLWNFLPSGELVGEITLPDQSRRIVLWQQGKWRTLPPLPGYSSTYPLVGVRDREVVSVPQGLIGYSYNVTKKLSKTRSQATLWRNGKPEPLKGFLSKLRMEDNNAHHIWASNKKGTLILNKQDLNTKNGFQVYSEGKLTPILTESRDSRGNILWKGLPEDIGENGVLRGELEREGKDTTMGVWFSPMAQPRPLWEPSSPVSKFPIRGSHFDAEGNVVGMMKDPITQVVTPFIWKAGRYRDLQTLLPPNSDWVLQGAIRAGRTVIGMGQYKGKPTTYRLTLPPGVP